MRAELLQLAALCAAFWTAVALYRGEQPLRFVAALGAGAVLAHAGFALLHLPAVLARPWSFLDVSSGFSVLFVPLGLLLFTPTAAALATLPLALAVARLGCLAAGCCHGAAGEPTPLVEVAGLVVLHAAVRKLPERGVVPAVLAGLGLLRLATEPWRADPPLGEPLLSPSALAAAWLVTAALWGAAGRRRGRGRLALARRGWPVAVIGCLACAGTPAQDVQRGEVPPPDASAPASDSYLELVAVRDEFKDTYLMHWPLRKMPLAVYLPRPPQGLFEDPDGIFEAVRSGVLDWADAAAPEVPSFRFVDAHADADIPIAWAEKPDGDWYIAFCSYVVRPRRNLFDVEQILVTGRWRDGRVASSDEIHEVVLHEMGHALGLLGHSDDTRDVMYPSVSRREGRGLSDRDRNTLRELYAQGNRQIRGRRGRPD